MSIRIPITITCDMCFAETKGEAEIAPHDCYGNTLSGDVFFFSCISRIKCPEWWTVGVEISQGALGMQGHATLFCRCPDHWVESPKNVRLLSEK